MTIPALIQIVKRDKSRELRSLSVLQLGLIGEKNPAVKAALTEALNDPYSDVRERASESLRRIKPEVASKAGGK